MQSTEKIVGIHAVSAYLQHDTPGIETLFLQEKSTHKRLAAIEALALAKQVSITYLAADELARLAPAGTRHQGVVALVTSRPDYHEADLEDVITQHSNPIILVLDGVQDPHNLGACLRSAFAMGAHAVVVPKDRAAKLTPVVRKVACGGAECVPLIRVTNLSRTLTFLKQAGLWLVGASGDAPGALSAIDLTGPIAIVMGGEGGGMRRLTASHCDYLAAIPMPGGAESLNVSVATGIMLYELVRQRTA
jgi:23S rRNA (guanosine2251-2'-O)-methyltransferase